jgi:hypothetical protein
MKTFSTAITMALLLCGTARAADDAPGAAPSAVVSSVLSQFAAKHLVMFYRKETDDAPDRLDPTIQAVSAALQHEFLDRHFKLTQPSPDALAALDHGPDVIVTFAPDAGMSMIYSVYSNLRPTGAPDMGIAEIRISAQVLIGSSILSVEEGHGQVQTRTNTGAAAYGVRKAYEVAAKDAANEIADNIEARLQELTADEVAQMVTDEPTTFTIVNPKPPAPPAAPAPAPSPAPSPAPAPAPTPDGTPAPSGPSVATTTSPGAPPLVGSPSADGTPVAAPDATPAPAANRWLLAVAVGDISKVVGISGDNLPGPATDLKNIQSSLRGLGFDEKRTVALLDQAATTSAVIQSLAHFKQVVQPDDEFVFYISGHGLQMSMAPTGKTVPVLYDTNARDKDLLDFGRLAKLIGEIPARQSVMLIDTCHAGAAAAAVDSVVISAGGVRAAKLGGAPELSVMLRGVKATGGDMAVFSASRADESSIDRGPIIGGLFTSEFIKAIQATNGAAPLQVIYSNYVLPNVTDFCAKRSCQQTPMLGYDGSGNLIRLGGNQASRGARAAPAGGKATKTSAAGAEKTT